MTSVLICGINGRMGQFLVSSATAFSNLKIVAGIDLEENLSLSIPVYSSFSRVKEKIDVIIDFSTPKLLDDILSFATKNNVALVSATTGYTKEDIEKIENASKKIAIFKSANYSLGINVICELAKLASKILKGFDIEIIEKHHNMKVDAPSGTALMIADEIKTENPELYYTYGRQGMVGKRNANEIGIHAIRGGNIVGEHQTIFAGQNEIVTLSHEASSRKVFADGALNAATFIADKSCGLFNMKDLVKSIL